MFLFRGQERPDRILSVRGQEGLVDFLLVENSFLLLLEWLLELLGDGIKCLLERAVLAAHVLRQDRIIVERRVRLYGLIYEGGVCHVHLLRHDPLLKVLIEECLLLLFQQLDHQ